MSLRLNIKLYKKVPNFQIKILIFLERGKEHEIFKIHSSTEVPRGE